MAAPATFSANSSTEVRILEIEGFLNDVFHVVLDVVTDVGGIIAQGKEATVHHALGSTGGPVLFLRILISLFLILIGVERSEFAVKVYKTTKLEFRDREKYIAGEHRFRHVLDLGSPLSSIFNFILY